MQKRFDCGILGEMAFAQAENRMVTGLTRSVGSICEKQIKKSKRASSSFPFIKPQLTEQNICTKIKTRIVKFCKQGFKKCPSDPQKETLSLDESKDIIRELAAELDRVVQFKRFSLLSGKMNNEGTVEEQQSYILQWAKELDHIQADNDQISQNECPQISSEDVKPGKEKVKEAKKTVSDWTWRMRKMKPSSICPNDFCKDILQELYKEWKRGKTSILQLMDWMMWTVMHAHSSEDAVYRKWLRSKQRSKIPGGFHIPNSVWYWITKSAAVVLLDPDTANPEIRVSEDRKSLKTKTHEESLANSWKELQRHHFKYDGWTCVQAKEGYTTGRHYWEVDVRKKCEWRLGVVKESATRNGYVNMNTKTGYWNLRLQLGTLIALNEPATKLNLPNPSKIGIYLDIEEGQVSFYDAEKRRHIYTFYTKFSRCGKIYPVFGTVETERELVIS